MENTTIAALSTAAGRGGIAIVRLSGPDAARHVQAIFAPAARPCPWESHRLYYGHAVWQGRILDECMAVLMRAPRSYTREDVAELHLHGGDYAAASILEALYQLGACPAAPGEFTRRAFLNGRVDLSRAEAVMQLIAANGQAAADAALRQLSGSAGEFIGRAQQELAQLIAGVEAALDYPEEIDEAQAAGDIAPRAQALAHTLRQACDERAAHLLESGLDVVICGKPNVGKSSLLNALLRQERAIVTDIPGTTRDIVQASRLMAGVRVHFSDTAGIRAGGETVEQLGIERARRAVQNAGLALLVLDASQPLDQQDAELLDLVSARPHLVVLNKADLSPQAAVADAILVSAQTRQGLDVLEQRIAEHAQIADPGALTLARHIHLARQAAASLEAAAQALGAGQPLDVCAVDLHAALLSLGEITGEQVDDQVLDRIFATFCVGK